MAQDTRKRRQRRFATRLAVGAGAGVVSAALGAFAFAPVASANESEHGDARHAVFVQTNDPAGNAVLTYIRGDDGQLTLAGRFVTGGLGGSEAGAVVDPLASQGSLTYDSRHHLLLAVNAGSDTFTVFGVAGAKLQRLQILGSGGQLPTSISVAGDVVYVLNAGGDGAISGFDIGDRSRVRAIEGSTRSLGLANPANPNFLSAPSQVAVTPDRQAVVVATKTHGVIDVFASRHHRVPSAAPVVTSSAGAVPFGLSFDSVGRLLVAEASGGESSYRVLRDGGSMAISAHVANGQAATCWSAVAKGFVYVANAGSHTITGYSEDGIGELALLDASGVTATTDAGPVDLVASLDGRYLYQEATGAGASDEFAVGNDGSLTRIGAVTGFTPDNGAGLEGIAAS